jgi:hypothetical protein
MQDIIHKLIKGDHSIVNNFVAVKQKWDDVFKDFNWYAPDALDKMVKIVSTQQIPFEDIVGNTWLGQEIMVIVGIGQFYSVVSGFDDRNSRKVKLIRDAIFKSSCSTEVKSLTTEIFEFYSIEEDESEEEFEESEQ